VINLAIATCVRFISKNFCDRWSEVHPNRPEWIFSKFNDNDLIYNQTFPPETAKFAIKRNKDFTKSYIGFSGGTKNITNDELDTIVCDKSMILIGKKNEPPIKIDIENDVKGITLRKFLSSLQIYYINIHGKEYVKFISDEYKSDRSILFRNISDNHISWGSEVSMENHCRKGNNKLANAPRIKCDKMEWGLGIRTKAFLKNEEIILESELGTIMNMSHIKNQLKYWMELNKCQNIIFDGKLYVGDLMVSCDTGYIYLCINGDIYSNSDSSLDEEEKLSYLYDACEYEAKPKRNTPIYFEDNYIEEAYVEYKIFGIIGGGIKLYIRIYYLWFILVKG